MKYSLLIAFLAFVAVLGSLIRYWWFESFDVNVLLSCEENEEGCEITLPARQDTCDVFCDGDATCTVSDTCKQ
jgi:hypothetical protein